MQCSNTCRGQASQPAWQEKLEEDPWICPHLLLWGSLHHFRMRTAQLLVQPSRWKNLELGWVERYLHFVGPLN